MVDRRLGGWWGDAVVVAVVAGEAELAVQGAGGGVAVFDLEVQVMGAAGGGLGGQRGGQRPGQAAAPVRRIDLDGGQAAPAPGHRDPAGGQRHAVLPE
jgi:hypothetical protein